MNIISCTSTQETAQSEGKTSLKNFENGSMQLVEEYPDKERGVLPLENTLKNKIDNDSFRLARLILTVKYDEEGEYDTAKDNRNEQAKFLERHLFEVLKQIQRDLSVRTSILLDFDDVLLESTSQEEKKLGPIRPNVFRWEGLTLHSEDGGVGFLVSDWQNISMLESFKEEAVFNISMSFIHEKNFIGYRVHISFILYNTDSRFPQKYTTNYRYKIKQETDLLGQL